MCGRVARSGTRQGRIDLKPKPPSRGGHVADVSALPALHFTGVPALPYTSQVFHLCLNE